MFNLPNLLTIANLLCGCMAIHATYTGNLLQLLSFFAAALFFDLLDGLAARALGQSSELGAQLDSLADMVSFGVLPGVLFFHLIDETLNVESASFFPSILGFVFTAAAALRLAKFNLDDRQSKDFLGLNTPAATIAVVGLYFDTHWNDCIEMFIIGTPNLVLTLVFLVVLSVLLLVDLPMLSFKFDTKDKSRSLYQGLLIGGGIIILILMRTCAMPFLILWYILFSIIRLIIEKSRS